MDLRCQLTLPVFSPFLVRLLASLRLRAFLHLATHTRGLSVYLPRLSAELI